MTQGRLMQDDSLFYHGCLCRRGSLLIVGFLLALGLSSRAQMSVVQMRDGIGVSNWQAFQLAPLLMKI